MSHVPQLTKLEALLARVLERRELPRAAGFVQSAASAEPDEQAVDLTATPVSALPAVEAVGAAEPAPEALAAASEPAELDEALAVAADDVALEVSAERPAQAAPEAEEIAPESDVEPPAATLASTQQHLAAVVPLPSRALEVQVAEPAAVEPRVPLAEVSHARLTEGGREVQGVTTASPADLHSEPAEEVAAATSAVEPPVSSARSVDPSVEDESQLASEAPPESTPLSSPAAKAPVAPQQVQAQLAAADVVAFEGELPLARRSVRAVLARALAL